MANATAPVVAVDNVCFAYHEREVLHRVNFNVMPNALVVMVGPNGGGKTTLLRLLLGEIQPLHGHLSIFGQTPIAARRQVGYVPQVMPFDPRFPASVLEVVLMGRVAHSRWGHYARADRQVALASLARVGLAGFEQRAFAALSGGERQRVLIAQALAGEPRLLLLDEPVANVDPAHVSHLYDLFKELSQQLTILLVSHNLSVVTSHATHVLCVNGTATLHPLNEVMTSTFQEAFGGRLAAITHGGECHVLDASKIMHQPHS